MLPIIPQTDKTQFLIQPPRQSDVRADKSSLIILNYEIFSTTFELAWKQTYPKIRWSTERASPALKFAL
jgi:hypothetical protein